MQLCDSTVTSSVVNVKNSLVVLAVAVVVVVMVVVLAVVGDISVVSSSSLGILVAVASVFRRRIFPTHFPCSDLARLGRRGQVRPQAPCHLRTFPVSSHLMGQRKNGSVGL